MKKAILLLMIISLVFSMAACKENTNADIQTNLDFEIGDTGGLKVPFGNGETITVLCVDEVSATNTYIFDKLSQVVGLNVKPMLVPKSTFNQKLQVLLAGDDIPDIARSGSLNETNKYALQGAWEPINAHLNEMPNFKKYFGKGAENDWVFKSLAAGDGNLYVFPTLDVNRIVNHGMLYRKDIFDKHGIEMWNSPETFYQALKKLKELYPESYPLTSKTGKNLLMNYGVAWGGLNAYGIYYNEDEKVWKYSDTDPKMKEMLDYFKKLYDEKLLDPEFLTNTQSAWTQRMTTGTSFVTYDWIGRLDMFQAQSTIEGYDLRYGNPVGPNQTLVTLEQISRNGTVVSKNKNASLSMKLMDFLYSDAGAELMTCGVRGETFVFDEETGMAKYLDFEEGKKVEITDLSSKYCMWMDGSYRKVDRRSCYFQYTEREQEAQEWVEKCNGLEPADPVVTISDEKVSARVAELINGLTKSFEEVMFKYIVGQKTGDSAWEEWLKKAKKLGEDEIVKIFNDRHKELGL